MLVQFRIQNYRSFKDEQIFNLVATADDAHPAHVVETFDPDIKILRGAALYGANASGKSNFFKALEKMKEIVSESLYKRPDDSVGFDPFLLAPTDEPTIFEVILYLNETFYFYGFAFNENIEEEWLLKRKENDGETPIPIFIREKGNQFVEKKLGNPAGKKEGYLDFLTSYVRSEQLFLSYQKQEKIQEMEAVYEWFNSLWLIAPEYHYLPGVEGALNSNKDLTKFATNALKLADTGVAAIEIIDYPIDVTQLPDYETMKTKIKNSPTKSLSIKIIGGKQGTLFLDKDNNYHYLELNFLHNGGDDRPFTSEQESSGTMRFMELLPMIYEYNAPNRSQEPVIIIDELDRSLHTELCQEIVKIVLERGRGQLIFTTHDTNLLDFKLLRADEIWFTEKNRKGESRLYSLAEFNREQLKQLDPNLEIGYLQGRFGATPYIPYSGFQPLFKTETEGTENEL